MKKFVLKRNFNRSLIAWLNLKDISSSEIWEAFPIINAWVKDMTNGEINIDTSTINCVTSITSDNFMVCCNAGLVKVYKVEKPSFYIEEVKE